MLFGQMQNAFGDDGPQQQKTDSRSVNKLQLSRLMDAMQVVDHKVELKFLVAECKCGNLRMSNALQGGSSQPVRKEMAMCLVNLAEHGGMHVGEA